MKEVLRPLGDKIVVRREKPETASPGGILIPDKSQEKPIRGVVVAVGPGRVDNNPFSASAMTVGGLTQPMQTVSITARVSMSVKVGDVVLFSAYSGSELEVNGESVLIMREDDILCVVEKGK